MSGFDYREDRREYPTSPNPEPFNTNPDIGFTEEPGGAPTNPYVPDYVPDYEAVPSSDRGTYDTLSGGGYTGYEQEWSAPQGYDPGSYAPDWDPGTWNSSGSGGWGEDPGWGYDTSQWTDTEWGGNDPGQESGYTEEWRQDPNSWRENAQSYGVENLPWASGWVDKGEAGASHEDSFYGIDAEWTDPEGNKYYWDPTARNQTQLVDPRGEGLMSGDRSSAGWGTYATTFNEALPELRNNAYTTNSQAIIGGRWQQEQDRNSRAAAWAASNSADIGASSVRQANDRYWTAQNASARGQAELEHDYADREWWDASDRSMNNWRTQAQQAYSDQWHQQQEDQGALYDYLRGFLERGYGFEAAATRAGLTDDQIREWMQTLNDPAFAQVHRERFIGQQLNPRTRVDPRHLPSAGDLYAGSMGLFGAGVEAIDAALVRIPGAQGGSQQFYEMVVGAMELQPDDPRFGQRVTGPVGAGFGALDVSQHQIMGGIVGTFIANDYYNRTGQQVPPEQIQALGEQWSRDNPQAAFLLENVVGAILTYGIGKYPATAASAARGAMRRPPVVHSPASTGFAPGGGNAPRPAAVGGGPGPVSGLPATPPARPAVGLPGGGVPAAAVPDRAPAVAVASGRVAGAPQPVGRPFEPEFYADPSAYPGGLATPEPPRPAAAGYLDPPARPQVADPGPMVSDWGGPPTPSRQGANPAPMERPANPAGNYAPGSWSPGYVGSSGRVPAPDYGVPNYQQFRGANPGIPSYGGEFRTGMAPGQYRPGRPARALEETNRRGQAALNVADRRVAQHRAAQGPEDYTGIYPSDTSGINPWIDQQQARAAELVGRGETAGRGYSQQTPPGGFADPAYYRKHGAESTPGYRDPGALDFEELQALPVRERNAAFEEAYQRTLAEVQSIGVGPLVEEQRRIARWRPKLDESGAVIRGADGKPVGYDLIGGRQLDLQRKAAGLDPDSAVAQSIFREIGQLKRRYGEIKRQVPQASKDRYRALVDDLETLDYYHTRNAEDPWDLEPSVEDQTVSARMGEDLYAEDLMARPPGSPGGDGGGGLPDNRNWDQVPEAREPSRMVNPERFTGPRERAVVRDRGPSSPQYQPTDSQRLRDTLHVEAEVAEANAPSRTWGSWETDPETGERFFKPAHGFVDKGQGLMGEIEAARRNPNVRRLMEQRPDFFQDRTPRIVGQEQRKAAWKRGDEDVPVGPRATDDYRKVLRETGPSREARPTPDERYGNHELDVEEFDRLVEDRGPEGLGEMGGKTFEGLSAKAKRYLRNNAANYGVAASGAGVTFEEEDDAQTRALKMAAALTLGGALGAGLWAKGRYKSNLKATEMSRLPGKTQTPIGKKFWRLDTQRGDMASISGEHARNAVATSGLRVGEFDLAAPTFTDNKVRTKTIKELTDYVQGGRFSDMLESVTPRSLVEDAQVHNLYRLVEKDLVAEIPRIVTFEARPGVRPEVEFQRRWTAAVDAALAEHIGVSKRGPLVAGPEWVKRQQANFLLKPNPRWGMQNVRDRVFRQGEAKLLGQTGMQRVGKDKAAAIKALASDQSGAFGPLWLESEIAHDVSVSAWDRYNPNMLLANWNEKGGKQGIFRIHHDNYHTTAWARELGLEDRFGTITRHLDFASPFKGDAPKGLAHLPSALREELLGLKDLTDVREALLRNGVTGADKAEILSTFNSIQRDARAYAKDEATGAMRDYAMRSNLDTALSVVYPFHYWTTHGAPWTAKIAARYPLAAAAIVGATLWTLEQNKDLPVYQRASARIPTRWMIDHAPLSDEMKRGAHEALNWYLDDAGGKEDLRVGLLNWYQPAMTNVLRALKDPEKRALLDVTHPENIALFAETAMGWQGRSIAWTGAEAVLTNRRDQLPEWLREALPGTPGRNPSAFGSAGQIARGMAEVSGHGEIPRAVNETLYGKEFSADEQRGIDRQYRRLLAGKDGKDDGTLREAAIRAYFAAEVPKAAKYTAGVAPVATASPVDPLVARQQAFYARYGDAPGQEGDPENEAWWKEHGDYYQQMVMGDEPKDTLNEGRVRAIQEALPGKRRRAAFEARYGDPGKHEGDNDYWSMYNQSVKGEDPDDTLDEGKVDRFVLGTVRDKAGASGKDEDWQRYADQLDVRTGGRDWESPNQRGEREQAKSMWDFANDIEDQGARWDYLHSEVPGKPGVRVLDLINRNGGFYPQEKDPGTSPDITTTYGLTGRQLAAYNAEMKVLGPYLKAGTPGSTSEIRAAWAAESDRIKAKYGWRPEHSVPGGEYVPTGQQRGLPGYKGGAPSPSTSTSTSTTGSGQLPGSTGTGGGGTRTTQPVPSRTSSSGASSGRIPAGSRSPSPQSWSGSSSSRRSGSGASSVVGAGSGSGWEPRSWNPASTTSRRGAADAPYEPGRSAKEVADAYNAWEKRHGEGKADLREAIELVREHEKSGGNPAPYLRRVKYSVYEAVRAYRGENRQSGDKKRGAWFAEIKAMKDETKSLERLLAIYDEALGRRGAKPGQSPEASATVAV